MREFCQGRIAHYKIPRYVKLVDAFPMTVTGKVQKFKMREQAIDELGLADSAAVQHGVSGAEVGLALSVLAACAVEAVEALTIVLAVGATRELALGADGGGGGAGGAGGAHRGARAGAHRAADRRPAGGGGRAAAGLRPAVAAQGDPARQRPEGAARRAAPPSSEEQAAARAGRRRRRGLDAYSFTVAFKGVLLEGLEVVFIVLTFGANQHNVPLAAAAAAVAVVGVAWPGWWPTRRWRGCPRTR